jgi:uncharacterized membrane protein
MNLSAGLLPPVLYWLALVAFAGMLGVAIYKAPWKTYRKEPGKSHVWLGSCVLLLLLWQMDAGLKPGMSYHLLGATLFVLMFGWELAFIGLTLVLLGTTLDGMGDLQSLALNGMVMVAVPVLVSEAIYRLSVRFLPHHFFVYVLGNAFLCGALAMVATITAATVLLACCGPYSLTRVTHDYLPFAPLMIFAEAFFTGMIAASLVLFRPDWICTFDDRRYLSGK